MASRPTRTLIEIAAFAGIAWMWIAIYESFANTGLWLIISRALGDAATLVHRAAALATCVLLGWLSLAAASWLLWRLFLRARLADDFPTARLRR